MRGSWESALAIITRRFMPPDSVMILASFLSHSDRSFSIFSIWAGFLGLPNRPRLKRTVAQTVSKASVVSSCGTSPISERAARKSVTMSCPSASTCAFARLDDAADDVDQRRLAGAVRTEQRENLAVPDLEVDALERLEARSIGLGQVGYGNVGCMGNRLQTVENAPEPAPLSNTRSE